MNINLAQRQYRPTFKGSSNDLKDPDNVRKTVNGTAIGAAAGTGIGSLGKLISRELDIKELHKQYDRGINDLRSLTSENHYNGYYSGYNLHMGIKDFDYPYRIKCSGKEECLKILKDNEQVFRKSSSKAYREFTNKKILRNGAIGFAVGAVLAGTAMLVKIVNKPKQDNTEQN